MKQNYLSALVVLCSCSISQIEPIEQSAEREKIESQTEVGGPQKMMAQSNADSLNFDEVKALLDQMGYNTETLTEYDEYYLIYSDLIFYKYDIIHALKQQNFRANTVNTKDGRYFVSLMTFGDSQITGALQSAVNDWNLISDVGVNFKSTVMGQVNTGRPDVNIYVQPNLDAVNSFLIVDKFALPYKILINTKHGFWETTKNSIQLQYLFEHALGHILGLEHSTDYTSIMQDETGLSKRPYDLWSGLSSSDRYNIGKLYPLIPIQYGYEMSPQVQADADKRIKLEINQVYTVTPSYTYAWVTDPKFTYQVVSGSAVITPSDKSFTIKLDKQGPCTVRITAKDGLGEAHPDGIPYEFDLTFYAELDIPRFFPPLTMKVGEYANFEVLFDPTGYKNVTYTMSGYETLFDNNSNRNVEIMKNGSSFKVKLRDYGRYRLITTVTYDEHKSTFIYSVGRHARPLRNVERFERTVANSYELPSHSSPPKTPTGPNQIYEDHTKITFGTSPVLLERVVYDLSFYYLKWVMHFPGRPDKDSGYRYGDIYQKDNVLRTGQPAVIDHVRYGMYHPDSINYVDHYTILHPETNVYYPSDYAKVISVEHN